MDSPCPGKGLNIIDPNDADVISRLPDSGRNSLDIFTSE